MLALKLHVLRYQAGSRQYFSYTIQNNTFLSYNPKAAVTGVPQSNSGSNPNGKNFIVFFEF